MKPNVFHFSRAGALALLALTVGCSSSEQVPAPAIGRMERPIAQVRQAVAPDLSVVYYKDACTTAQPDEKRCLAKVVTDQNGDEIVNAVPTMGLFPADLRAAYGTPATGGNGRLVAIIGGFHYANAEADMNVYRQQFGIPACTTANGCFKVVNSDGLPPDPMAPADPGWTTEAAVDLDMVSAMCPDCKILLVEARSGYAVDLGPAVQRAAAMGAFSINNSYGEPEDNAMMARLVEQDYNLPGILVAAGSGDDGYGKSTEDDGTVVNQNMSPANLPWVMAVGGTTLRKAAGGRGWTETVWKGAGSGCSSHAPKPAWQKDTGCSKKMIADVAAVADPATGVAYYTGGWKVVGGTSIAGPIVVGIFSIYGIWSVSWPYENPSAFFDITSGNNGSCPTPYMCTGQVGYDGPTGLGTPNGAMFPKTPPPPPPTDGGTPDSGNATGGGAAGAGGGVGGGGGAGGSGGGAASGGTGGASSGIGGGAGSSGTTGSTTGSAGASSSTASTTTGDGTGTMGAGGANNPLPPKAEQGNGCSCRVGADSHEGHALAGAWLLGIGIVATRRKRSRGAKVE
jgi:MYXO-CTERM domain-containing protein